MKMRGLLVLSCAVVALVMSGAWAQAAGSKSDLEPVVKPAPPASAEVTIVGRGTHAAEVTKDGQVKEVTPGKVAVGKPIVKIVVVPGKKDATAEENAGAKALEKEKEAAAQEALKQADVEAVKKMRDDQRMWFFDQTGKVMTKEELDKRIEEGDVSGIKAVDDDRNEWTPKSDQDQADQTQNDPPNQQDQAPNFKPKN